MTSNLVMPIQYRGNAALAPVKDELGEITHYSANRTYILDRIQSLVGSKAVVLTGYGDQKETLITHLTDNVRSEEHTSELQSLMRNSYAVFCLKKKKKK